MHEQTESPYLVPENQEIENPERKSTITGDALEALREWGISDEQIEGLATISARYEYADSSKRMQQIVERGGIITRDFDGEGVLLPDFYDLGDRVEGQCGEIALKVLADIKQGWLKEVNDANVTLNRPQLNAYFVHGNSRTHFTDDLEDHYWVGIGELDNTDPTKLITIDGSFLEISHPDSNGYRAKKIDDLRSDTLLADEFIKLGYLDDEDGKLSADFGDMPIIGLTNDRQMAISIAFAIDRSTEDGVVRPVLQIRDADSVSRAYCWRVDEAIKWTDESGILDSSTVVEVKKLLMMAGQINLTEDPQAGWRSQHNTTTIQLE